MAKATRARASAPSDMTRTPVARQRLNGRARKPTLPPANRRPLAASRRLSRSQCPSTSRNQHTPTPMSLTTLLTTTTQCRPATPHRCIPRLRTPLLLRLLLPRHRPTTAHLLPDLLRPVLRPRTPPTQSVKPRPRGRHPPCTPRTILLRHRLPTGMRRTLLCRGLTTTRTRRRRRRSRRAVQPSRRFPRAMLGTAGRGRWRRGVSPPLTVYLSSGSSVYVYVSCCAVLHPCNRVLPAFCPAFLRPPLRRLPCACSCAC